MSAIARRTIRLAPTPAAPAAARHALAWLEPHVDARRYANLRLAVTELVANAIEHGGGGVPEGVVEVGICVGEHSVRVDVRDAGARFTPPLPPSAPPLGSPRGRGLMLVDRLSDRFGVAGPSHLWVEVDRDAADGTLA
jgi:anti-sigma regulatory factor (Ser/Thr protein kinase)